MHAHGLGQPCRYASLLCRTVPFLVQAAKQGFQDFGAIDLPSANKLLMDGALRMETRTGAAQKEGGVHDMLTFEKKPW